MPVRHDVHSTCGATFLADEARADRRPGQVLRQGVQSDIVHASIARTARTLDVAGYGAVREPFCRAAGGICPSIETAVAATPLRMIPRATMTQIINGLWIEREELQRVVGVVRRSR
jgi:hypothetical protein